MCYHLWLSLIVSKKDGVSVKTLLFLAASKNLPFVASPVAYALMVCRYQP